MARRWQNRYNALLSQQEEQGNNNEAQQQDEDGIADLLDLAGGAQNNVRLSGLRAMLQEMNDPDSNNEAQDEESDGDDDVEPGDVEDMDEDDVEDYQEGDYLFGDDANESDAEDFASAAEVESEDNENSSVVMEDADNSIVKTRSINQPRTVSISSAESL